MRLVLEQTARGLVVRPFLPIVFVVRARVEAFVAIYVLVFELILDTRNTPRQNSHVL